MFSWLVVPRVGNRQHLRCGPESVDVPGRGTAVGREGREFIGRQSGANRAGREGRKQTAHPDVWGVVCVVCASPRCPGANQGREGAAGSRSSSRSRGLAWADADGNRGPDELERPPASKPAGVGGRGSKTENGEGKRTRERPNKKRDERERNACVCQARAKPRCCLDACCFTSSFPRGGECSAASKAGTKPRLGILKELQHYPSGSSHCKAAVLGTSTPSTPSTPAPGAS